MKREEEILRIIRSRSNTNNGHINHYFASSSCTPLKSGVIYRDGKLSSSYKRKYEVSEDFIKELENRGLIEVLKFQASGYSKIMLTQEGENYLKEIDNNLS